MTLGCFQEFNMKGSIWSYRPYTCHFFGRLEKTVLYLSPSLCQFFRRTKSSSYSKLELPFYHLLLEFCKKTKWFSFGKRLKTGCPGPQKCPKMSMPLKGLTSKVGTQYSHVLKKRCYRLLLYMDSQSQPN